MEKEKEKETESQSLMFSQHWDTSLFFFLKTKFSLTVHFTVPKKKKNGSENSYTSFKMPAPYVAKLLFLN